MLRAHWRFISLVLLSTLFTGLLFCQGLGGGFLLDDGPTITENSSVQITTLDSAALMQASYSFAAGGGSRALPMLSFALDYHRAGLDPTAFKLTNIAIHGLTTLALAAFFRLLLGMAGWPSRRAEFAAIAMALAWALHPLQVSSVLYVVQRMQTLATLFLVLALWAYLLMRQAQQAGLRSRQYGALTGLCWALALASKEDAALLPAYTLALELTVLRFAAASPRLAGGLKRGYLTLTLLGLAAFFFVALPHYWSWEDYHYRDFNSLERLLTQARVLAMYLWEILLPLPSHLPFYYDDLQPSRGLLQPWTTLPALLLVLALLVLAWWLRQRRPLLALGIFLFFAGHAISSNIIGLELAFEHRNHFPLIGAVLAAGDAILLLYMRLQLNTKAIAAAVIALIAGLTAGTWIRASAWNSPIGFSEYGTHIAPLSERAWTNLCQTHFELSNNRPESQHFKQALAACNQGASLASGATNLTNLILLKTIDGSVRPTDWERLYKRLHQVTMTPSNVGVAWHLVRYSNGDPRVDPRNVLHILDIIGARSGFRPEEYVAFGYYASKHQLDGYRYFAAAVQRSPPRSTLPAALVADLLAEGQPAMAARVQALIGTAPNSAARK